MKRFLILASIAAILLQGCGDKKEEVNLPDDSEVLATVNGSSISRFDLDLDIKTLLGPEGAGKVDATERQKILEGLVMNRAISLAQEKDASTAEMAVINRKAAAYREKLLIRQYFAKNAPPQPVTPEMIRDYYQKSLDEFDPKNERIFEVITSKRPLKAEESDALLKNLQKPEEKSDWQQWAKELQKQGYPVSYRKGPVVEKTLTPQMRKMMGALKKGATSPLTFIKDRCYLVKFVDEKEQSARPLKEVSGKIRKRLVSLQLKKSIKQASQEALQKAVVEYR